MNVLINEALQLFEEERYAECVETCRNALDQNPADAPSYNIIGSALNAMGKYEKL